jgi:RNA polymerase sigma-70 factor (ECF subfamily)
MGDDMLDIVRWSGSPVGRRSSRVPTRRRILLPRIILPRVLAALVKGRGIRERKPPDALGLGEAAVGDPAASDPVAYVDDLYERHARALLGYLRHRLPSLADAEDILAEVFLAAVRAATLGELVGAGWLMTLAQRRIADFYRQRRALPLTEEQLRVSETLENPEWMALRAEERQELLALVANLPTEKRDVLSLRFAGGLRSAEIANLIGKTDEATRALLSRAIRQLRKEWRG